MVEYQFYRNFPAKSRTLTLEAMAYITSKVPCIKFRPKIESTSDFVTIYDGVDCSSEVGRVGGSQKLNLNRCTFQSYETKNEADQKLISAPVSTLV